MPQNDPAMLEFFTSYGNSLVQGVVPSIIDSYAYPSSVITGEGSIVVLSEGDIHEALSGALNRYHDEGIAAAIPTIDQCMRLDDHLYEVTITWTYQDRSGADISAESYRYFIRTSAGSYLIAATIPIATS